MSTPAAGGAPASASDALDPKTWNEKVSKAYGISFIQTAQNIVFFMLSFLSTLYATSSNNKMNECDKQFMYISVGFMVFASLTYAKNSKDLELASNFSKNALAKFVSGGNSYTMLIFTAWVFSVYFPFNTILNKQSDIMGPTTGFQLLGLSFLLTSTLGLARVLRDTSDKANFLNFPKGDQTREHLDQVIALAKSSTLFVIVNVIALVVAFFVTIVGITNFPESQVSVDRKIILVMGLVGAAYTIYLMAAGFKAVAGGKTFAEERMKIKSVAALGSVVFLVSMIKYILDGADQYEQEYFTIIGSLYCLSTIINCINDHSEEAKVKSS